MRHFLSLFDFTTEEITHLLQEATTIKEALNRGERPAYLANRVLGMVFEKPSLRTRASFEAGMAQMGGSTLFFSAIDAKLGERESVPDFAQVFSEYVDAVVLRTYSHATIEEFARYSRVPVINGLSDSLHPCQALSDLLTIQEAFGDVEGRTLAFIGDGNNVARSLAVCCARLGMRFVLASPDGYHFDEPFVQKYRQLIPKGDMLQNGSPQRAVESADVIYTDVWTSMGQEGETEQRKAEFAAYQVNSALLEHAPKHCKVMHCLPAHRGEEISAEIMESDRSIIFQQAGNRMHAQKALLKWILTS